MRLLKKYSIPSQVLYQGKLKEKRLKQEFCISFIDSEFLSINLNKDELTNIESLLGAISVKDKERFIKEEGLNNSPPVTWKDKMSESEFSSFKMDYYKQHYHLPVQYILKKDNLIVLTYGELKPTLWILILEGVWRVEL